MQALCYFCRKWYHIRCLQAVDIWKAQRLREQKWNRPAPKQLKLRAMGTMRRGHPHTIEGEYRMVYQAQSILSALAKNDSSRLNAWIADRRKNELDATAE